jgi:hypothetical protein
MPTASVVFSFAVALSVVYVALSVAAVPHIKPELKKRQADWLHALMLWWPFYPDMYDGSSRVKKLRIAGGVLLPVIAALYIASYLAGHGA